MAISKHAPGSFSWADMASPDAEASRRFYTDLLQVESTDMDAGPDAFYTMLMKDGKPRCAIYQAPPELLQALGGRGFWQCYFTIADADAMAQRIAELGGAIAQPPMDVFDAGRMLAAQDPTGAVFALWQPRGNIGAEVMHEPGALAWSELCTTDLAAAEGFYGALFGWELASAPSADGVSEYFYFTLDGAPAAGMMAIQPEWGEVPPHWSPYFAVESLAAARARADTHGVTEVTPVFDIPEVGAFQQLMDPHGAPITIIQLAQGPLTRDR